MTYVYICPACRQDHHENCEQSRDVSTDPEVCGGGVCVCSHGPVDERGAFEVGVWERP